MNIFEIIGKLKEISKKVSSNTKVYFDNGNTDEEIPIMGVGYFDKLDNLVIFGEGKVITINKLIKRLEELMSNYNITEETTVTYEDAHTLDDVFINHIFVIDNSVILTD